MKIFAFGIAADKMKSSCVMAENIHHSAELRVWLNQHYPELKGLNISIAVNKKIIQTDIDLSEDAEVALLPPFSGG
ncbi:MAG: MoaD/ThiS family protein [Bacteroidetes bacterium]|nr:MoaD/ThiS family protein [Bacteroidota bacterium]MBS1541256.1 MoaD/ThiS family protein [Bacteroidota bacterium]